MAPLRYLSPRQVLVIYLVLFLFASSLVCSSHCSDFRPQKAGKRRALLETENEDVVLIKKKSSPSNINGFSAAKNQTKLLKQHLQKEDDQQTKKKNQTKLLQPSADSANPPKKLNSTAKSSNSTKTMSDGATIVQLKKKLNSTSMASNSTKSSSGAAAAKKPTGLLKPSAPKNKTTIKPIAKTQADEKLPVLESKTKKTEEKAPKPKRQKPEQPSWIEQEDDADLVSELRDLPLRFQQTLVPDLERISTTSRAYIFKANKEITRGFNPIVGKKYAPTIAPVISFVFILLPLLLVSLIFNRIKAYFSLQKILIFIQVYLSIYFSILCVSSLVTGLEPLRFFYATSQSTYVWLQVLQTLGYVIYLLLLLMYLVLVFSTDCGLASKLLGLAQTFVGFAIGLHYYVTVFHRVVLHQPPRTNWKVHGVYATCFLLICFFSGAERRKKAYLAEGGEEGKQS